MYMWKKACKGYCPAAFNTVSLMVGKALGLSRLPQNQYPVNSTWYIRNGRTTGTASENATTKACDGTAIEKKASATGQRKAEGASPVATINVPVTKTSR